MSKWAFEHTAGDCPQESPWASMHIDDASNMQQKQSRKNRNISRWKRCVIHLEDRQRCQLGKATRFFWCFWWYRLTPLLMCYNQKHVKVTCYIHNVALLFSVAGNKSEKQFFQEWVMTDLILKWWNFVEWFLSEWQMHSKSVVVFCFLTEQSSRKLQFWCERWPQSCLLDSGQHITVECSLMFGAISVTVFGKSCTHTDFSSVAQNEGKPASEFWQSLQSVLSAVLPSGEWHGERLDARYQGWNTVKIS